MTREGRKERKEGRKEAFPQPRWKIIPTTYSSPLENIDNNRRGQ